VLKKLLMDQRWTLAGIRGERQGKLSMKSTIIALSGTETFWGTRKVTLVERSEKTPKTHHRGEGGRAGL